MLAAMASYEKRTWWSAHQLTERLKDPSFLEAAVTTAFLIGAADGSVSEQEQDALLDRLEILGGVDRDKIDTLLTAVSQDVEANGFEPRISRVADLVDDKASAMAAVMLGLIPAFAMGPAPAEAKGCLKGAAVGGVAGHYAGHHGVLGAIGGCAVGHHMANEKAKEQAAPQGAQNAPSPPPAPTPN